MRIVYWCLNNIMFSPSNSLQLFPSRSWNTEPVAGIHYSVGHSLTKTDLHFLTLPFYVTNNIVVFCFSLCCSKNSSSGNWNDNTKTFLGHWLGRCAPSHITCVFCLVLAGVKLQKKKPIVLSIFAHVPLFWALVCPSLSFSASMPSALSTSLLFWPPKLQSWLWQNSWVLKVTALPLSSYSLAYVHNIVSSS